MTEKTKIYEATAIYDASNGYSTEATSLDEAIEKLEAQVHAPSLCHQCSSEVSVGDVVGIIVYCDGEEVADTRYEAEQLSKAKAALAAKDAEIARLNDAYRERWEKARYLQNEMDAVIAERDALRAQPARQVGGDDQPVAAVIAFYEGQRDPSLLSWNRLPNGEHRLYAAALAPAAVDRWAPSEHEYDRSIHHNPDAKAWADLFVATFPRLADKHDLMIGWFANAMMAMHDWMKSKGAAPAEVAVVMPEVPNHWELHDANFRGGWEKHAAEVARLNRRAIPEGLLERISSHLEWDGSPPMDTIQYAYKCDELAVELRTLLGKEGE